MGELPAFSVAGAGRNEGAACHVTGERGERAPKPGGGSSGGGGRGGGGWARDRRGGSRPRDEGG